MEIKTVNEKYKVVTPSDKKYLYKESEGLIVKSIRTMLSDDEITAMWTEIDATEKETIEANLESEAKAEMEKVEAERKAEMEAKREEILKARKK